MVEAAQPIDKAALVNGEEFDQAKWIHHHRNIQIQNVPPNKAPALKDLLESKENKSIHRIYIDGKNHRLHVSTTITTFPEVQKWLATELKAANLDYTPMVGKRTGTSNSTAKSAYSKMFTTPSKTSDGSFDSTIKTAQPNAWYKTRPVPLVIDFSAEADAFPPLTDPRQPKNDAPTTTSKISLSDDTTIKTALASAVQDLESRYERKLQDLSNRLTAKLRKLEETISKLEAMDSKIDLLVDRILDPHYGNDPNAPASYTTATTPTRKTKRQDTKATPRSRDRAYDVAPPQEDESLAMDYDNDYQQEECSATSTNGSEGPHL